MGVVGVKAPTLKYRWAGLQAATVGGRGGGEPMEGRQGYPPAPAMGRTWGGGGSVGPLLPPQPPPPPPGSVGEIIPLGRTEAIGGVGGTGVGGYWSVGGRGRAGNPKSSVGEVPVWIPARDDVRAWDRPGYIESIPLPRPLVLFATHAHARKPLHAHSSARTHAHPHAQCPQQDPRMAEALPEEARVSEVQRGVEEAEEHAEAPYEEALTCSVCLKQYDSEFRRPLMLPACGHTFCRSCVKGLACEGVGVVCPCCRREYKDTDVDNFPINFSVEILASSTKNQQKMKPVSVNECQEHGVRYAFWCRFCEVPACGECLFDGHPRPSHAICRITDVVKEIKSRAEELEVGRLKRTAQDSKTLSSITKAFESAKGVRQRVQALRNCEEPHDSIRIGDRPVVVALSETGGLAKVKVEERGIHIYSLRSSSTAYTVAVKMSVLLGCLKKDHPLVFLDLRAGDRPLGRVYIELWGHMKRAQQFMALCLGTYGPSYRDTRFDGVSSRGEAGEYVRGGDYSGRQGLGGEALMDNLEWGGTWAKKMEAGQVCGVGGEEERKFGALFAICLRDNPDSFFRAPFGVYPEWRPPAQWSRVIGRSHNTSYKLFTMGQAATEGLKQFAETGESALIEGEGQERLGVLDQFTAPPVPKGVGDTSSQFFVDGNHSMVSLISRVVPSPDWFIGLDSFDLCHEGSWRESVVIEVDPMDAGTDNGFTFTSPNWPTIPSKPITRITAQNPNHPANSFFYPDRERHPPIAAIRLFKIKEYGLTKIFTSASATPEHFARNLGSRRRPRPHHSRKTGGEDETRVETEENGGGNGEENVGERENGILASSQIGGSSGIGAGQGEEGEGQSSGVKTLINTIVNKYKKKHWRNRRGRKSGQRRQGGGGRRRVGGRRRMRAPRDCRVTEWAEWSSCSKTCGIGEQVRTRAVQRQSRRGGRACPSLQETTWCGSYRDCDLPHFAW
ncbi:hypothetical protein O3P69_019402 [Scylla paramamosain]|uniref:Spondin-2 n=1 Tax=Scylla paramamosain TaxID=85552 RepID=A0AAW0SWH5_SCYPA